MVITLSITVMMLLLTITEVTLLDCASQATINLYETLMSDKMTEPKRMEFMDLEYINTSSARRETGPRNGEKERYES